jgi:uncharacterized protein with ParB-like and HNH nuclease domain
MKNQKETIRKITRYLNNEEEQGGFWLPNIQRPFVWKKEQIERLFDSIMREYPIGTLLIWKAKQPIRMRKFIDNYTSNIKLTNFYVSENNKQKMLVLDGQQRLQSLFIGLKGSYERYELYFNVLSGDGENSDDVKYIFKFLPADKAINEKGWVKFKAIVFCNKQFDEIAEEIVDKIGEGNLNDGKKKLIRKNIAKVVKQFQTDENIIYQELDSIEYPETYTENDIVEIFIRANSGGTQLGKSDILFSLLTVNWEDFEENIETLLEELNKTGYKFSKDFILKTSLVLIGAGARYEVNKFRKKDNLDTIRGEWDNISNAIKDVRDFIYSNTFIRTDKALTSYLALIPIIYFRYHHKNSWKNAKRLSEWLLRILLTHAFSGSPDTLIDKCVRDIKEKSAFDVDSLYTIIQNYGRNIDIRDEIILNTQYGSGDLYLIFNLWYKRFDLFPSSENNAPQIDHIFPQSALRRERKQNPVTGRWDLMKYKQTERNQIGNCMLLTAEENGPGGKSDKSPEEWFSDRDYEYLNMHLIPTDEELWKIENYDRFIEERNNLILEKFKSILLYNA